MEIRGHATCFANRKVCRKLATANSIDLSCDANGGTVVQNQAGSYEVNFGTVVARLRPVVSVRASHLSTHGLHS